MLWRIKRMKLGAITDEELFILFARYDQEAIFYENIVSANQLLRANFNLAHQITSKGQ